MYDMFSSDIDLFSNKIFFYIETKNKPDLLKHIKRKHQQEVENKIPLETKQNDLIIWNAVYAREVISKGISKEFIHTIYNKYYTVISKNKEIEELHFLELTMAAKYMDIIIYNTEVTNHLAVNKVLQYLYINIENQVNTRQLEKAVGLSAGYLSACFKKEMGISIIKYSKKIKIDRAKSLLLNTNERIIDIALLLGFHDQSHFTRTFKDYIGLTPSQFRNNHYK